VWFYSQVTGLEKEKCNMIKFSRYILVFAGIIVASIALPSFYWTTFEKVPKSPMVYYSCVLNDFIIVNGDSRVDTKGKIYSADDYEKMLPCLFFRQLITDGTMPDSIKGVAMEPSAIARASSFYKCEPYKINAPMPSLYPMIESKSGKVNLVMPSDYFRIEKRMEFIDAKSNSINQEKSLMFTKALSDDGFTFPAKIIAGIPSVRKSCDEGYFVKDAANKLFQVKMEKGKPVVVKINTPEDLDIVYIEAVDIRSKEFYCYLFTRNKGIYLVMEDTYDLQRLPIEDFDPLTMSFKMSSDLFNKCIMINGKNWYNTVVVDDMYQIVDSYSEKWDGLYQRTEGKIFASIFPFELRTNDENSSYVNLYFKLSPGFKWIFINILCIITIIFVLKRRGWEIKSNITDLVIVALTGLFGLLSVLFFPNKFSKR
jgi:hypothetical protein